MKVKPACPLGRYEKGMRIRCQRLEGLCMHQYYKNCRGWWANSEQWTRCPVREDSRPASGTGENHDEEGF